MQAYSFAKKNIYQILDFFLYQKLSHHWNI